MFGSTLQILCPSKCSTLFLNHECAYSSFLLEKISYQVLFFFTAFKNRALSFRGNSTLLLRIQLSRTTQGHVGVFNMEYWMLAWCRNTEGKYPMYNKCIFLNCIESLFMSLLLKCLLWVLPIYAYELAPFYFTKGKLPFLQLYVA